MTGQADPEIKRATVRDAEALSLLATETFVETFGHLYRHEDLSTYLREEQSAEHYRQILQDPAVAIWLAIGADGRPTGFISAGPCKLPVPNQSEMAGEIRQLYLRASAQGRGLGTRLLMVGLAWLQEHGHHPLYIGVWSGNGGAQRLYSRHGFAKIGEYDYPVGQHLDREFILQRVRPPL
ncbi:MAG: GNAT family N-acetyltransferase [Gammaproteobacteria bacterium]